jgi:hypothetical protein
LVITRGIAFPEVYEPFVKEGNGLIGKAPAGGSGDPTLKFPVGT